jgi:hypothetical protein
MHLHRLKRNNIYIQIYDKLNNPDKEETTNTKTVNGQGKNGQQTKAQTKE